MSVWEGVRALRGTPGIEGVGHRSSAATPNDPHVVELTRENEPASVVNGRMAGTGIGYVRVAAIGPNTAAQVKSQIADLTKSGAIEARRRRAARIERHDRRGPRASRGCSSARARWRSARSKGGARETIAAGGRRRLGRRCRPSSWSTPARRARRRFSRRRMAGNQRADLIGEHTDRPGRVAEAGQAARRRRPLAVDDALPDAAGRSAARKGARADGPGRRPGRRVRRSRPRRPTRSSTRRSSDSAKKAA